MNIISRTLSSTQNDLKKWFKTNKLTIINNSVSIIAVSLVIFALLFMGRLQVMQSAEEKVENLSGMVARDAQSLIRTKIDALRGVAQMAANYHAVDIDQRRDFITESMRAGITGHTGIRDIFTIWRPDMLDGDDYRFANTENHDHTGQFISGFTRERGWVEPNLYGQLRPLLHLEFERFWGFPLEVVTEPRPGFTFNPLGTGDLRDFTWLIDVWIPIFSPFTSVLDLDVIGVVGATIHLEHLQYMAETVHPHETGRILLSSAGGMVFAHPNHETRGINILNPAHNLSPFSDEDYYRLRSGISASAASMDFNTFRTANELVIIYPIDVTSTMQRSGTHNLVYTPPWALVTVVPLSTIMATANQMMIFSIILIVIAGIAIGSVLRATSRSLTQHTQNLQRSLEQASTMQDNLKYGLFLINHEYIIQDAYSIALEKILSIEDLQGRSLMNIISSSLKDHEIKGFRDYIDMVFKDSFDKDLLASVNPINEFSYFSVATGEVKSLRTSFSLTEEGGKHIYHTTYDDQVVAVYQKKYILCMVEDITAEKELEKQLKEAETIRDNEMRSLFQVIQLDPRILSDFVADAEFGFKHINESLKSKKFLQQEILVEIYQALHAIKSNALILNLETLSARMHNLEQSVKQLQEDHKEENIPIDDFLEFMLELNDARKEVDILHATVLKIENFKTLSGVSKTQERYVLVETLKRVCNKTKKTLGKNVNFIVDEIDDVALDYGPRRIIKEILTQLIRNAVYHGIESPGKRNPAKPPEGEIRLSVRYMNDQIIIKLSDNGAGLDFDRIKKSAIESKLPLDPEKANSKDYLLKTIFLPGFSTVNEADYHAGRGIGLSLVMERVKDLQGNITVSTAKGKGTTFTIYIPLEMPAADHAS